jgi:hypothetical protein
VANNSKSCARAWPSSAALSNVLRSGAEPSLAQPLALVPYLFLHRPMTRGEHLAHCISYALIRARKVVRGLGLTLSKEERKAVAQAAVDELRQHGDLWRLDEELPDPGTDELHSTPKKYSDG